MRLISYTEALIIVTITKGMPRGGYFGLKICRLGIFCIKRSVVYFFRSYKNMRIFWGQSSSDFFVIVGSENYRYSFEPFFSNHNVDERSKLIV